MGAAAGPGRAAAALARIGGRDVVEALLAALDGAPTDTRREIVRTLGAIGDLVATDTLIGLLYDGEVVGAAAPALARIGGPTAVDALVAALTDPDYPCGRAPLHDALRRLMPTHRVPTGYPGHLTRDAVAEVRRLLWTGDLDATQILLGQIRDGIQSAEAIAGRRWSVAPYATYAVESVLATVSRQALLAHQSIGPDAQPCELDAFRTLTPQLTRLEELLAKLPEDMEEVAAPPPARGPVDEAVVRAMMRLLRGRDEETACMRRDTLVSLHRMGRLDSVAALGSTLDDRYWAVRLAAVAALRTIDDPETRAALRARLDDEHHEVRKAAFAIAARKDARVLRQAVRDPHGEVRAVAVMVAADVDDPESADVLAPLLTDSCRLVRLHAAEVLQRWLWTRDPVQVAISAGAWDEVVAAGPTAAGPLMRMLQETYGDDDQDKEPALHALVRLVTAHGRAIPEDVLRTGADFPDFPGPRHTAPDGGLHTRRVDASGLRQACREALR